MPKESLSPPLSAARDSARRGLPPGMVQWRYRMNTMPESSKRGWGWPDNSPKSHYFVGGRSLCCRWAYFGMIEDDRHDHPNNCKLCQKKLQKSNPEKFALK